MNGMAKVGAMISDVPGGSASLPSSVTQINLFCRECGSFFLTSSGDFGVKGFGVSNAIAFETNRRRIKHQQLTGIIFVKPETRSNFVNFMGDSSNKFQSGDPSTCKIDDRVLITTDDNGFEFHFSINIRSKIMSRSVLFIAVVGFGSDMAVYTPRGHEEFFSLHKPESVPLMDRKRPENKSIVAFHHMIHLETTEHLASIK